MRKLLLLLLLSPLCFAQFIISEGDGGLLSSCAVSAVKSIAFCDVAGDPANPDGLYLSANGAPYFQVGASQLNGVQSFNGRSGAVIPAGNDYSFSMLSGQVGLTQLPLIPFTSLTGQAQLSELPIIPFSQVSGTVPLNQIPQIPFGQVSGTASPTQLPPLSQLLGQVLSSQLPQTVKLTGDITCPKGTGTISAGFTSKGCTISVTAIQ